MKPDGIRARGTPWHSIILVCSKCTKKLDGGFGRKHDEPLRNVLRDALRQAGHRRDVRVIETRCMGLCPKRAVTALNASCPERIVAVPKGTSPEAALAALAVVRPALAPGDAGG